MSAKQSKKKKNKAEMSTAKRNRAARSGAKWSTRSTRQAGGRGGPTYFFNTRNIISLLSILILTSIAAIVVIGPFQRGLFFDEEFLTVHLVSFALFFIWGLIKLLRRDGSFLKTPLDYCIAALVLFYFLSFFVAVNRRAALGGFLKVVNYFVIYIMVFDLCRQADLLKFTFSAGSMHEEKDKEANLTAIAVMLHVLLAAGVAVAAAGLGTAAGVLNIPSAYLHGRLATPLQYYNTAAAYLMAAYFLALALVPLTKKWYWHLAYLCTATLMMTAIWLTFSRGGLLVLPVPALVFFIFVGKGERLRALLYMGISTMVSYIFAFRMEPFFRTDHPQAALRYIFLALAATVAAGALVHLFLRLAHRIKIGVAAAALLLAVAGAAYLVWPAFGPVQLHLPPEGEATETYVEQAVERVVPGEDYTIVLDIDARVAETSNAEAPEHVWRLVVLGYDQERQAETLLDYRNGATQGWENRELSFRVGERINRLDIRLYAVSQGAQVTARNMVLQNSTDKIPLGFVFYRALPARVYQRIFNVQDREAISLRWHHYADALKIIKDYPLLGTGGGGWSELYFLYQELEYFATEVHNHYLQVWVEAGVFAFIAFTALWIFLALAFIRFMLGTTNRIKRILMTAAVLPALTLGAHSMVDFNLSLGAVAIYLFVLLGMARAMFPGDGFMANWPARVKLPKLSWLTPTICIPAALILLAVVFSLRGGMLAAAEAVYFRQSGLTWNAKEKLAEAIRLDPYTASYHAVLADYHFDSYWQEIEDEQGEEEYAVEYLRDALANARKALELQPFNPEYNELYGLIILRVGQMEEGLDYFNRVVELRPFQSRSYERAAEAVLAVADFYVQEGDEETARSYLHRVFSLEKEAAARLGNAEPLAFYVGKAYYLLEERDNAARYLATVKENSKYYAQAQELIKLLNQELNSN